LHTPPKIAALLASVAASALSACASSSVHVAVSPITDGTLQFVVIERREFVPHRPATRRYEFVTPQRRMVHAREIGRFHARYEGVDGTWDTWRQPVAGHIVLSDSRHPRIVEFQLLEKWDGHIIPMTINGRYRPTPLHQ
jgi:hypothetical protein